MEYYESAAWFSPSGERYNVYNCFLIFFLQGKGSQIQPEVLLSLHALHHPQSRRQHQASPSCKPSPATGDLARRGLANRFPSHTLFPGLQYLLVFTDTFAGWVEASLLGQKAAKVAKVLLTEIIPMFTKRLNQSILKEISPEYSLEGVMLKLKFQYFGHLIGRADSLEKTLGVGDGQESLACCSPWGRKESDMI